MVDWSRLLDRAVPHHPHDIGSLRTVVLLSEEAQGGWGGIAASGRNIAANGRRIGASGWHGAHTGANDGAIQSVPGPSIPSISGPSVHGG